MGYGVCGGKETAQEINYFPDVPPHWHLPAPNIPTFPRQGIGLSISNYQKEP